MSATGSKVPTKNDMDERVLADLLSNDLTKIRAAVAKIEEGEKEIYREQLLTLMRSDRPPRERVSAGNGVALVGDPRPGVDPEFTALERMEFCYVPPGPFWMGSDDDEMASEDEKPLHTEDLPYGYWVARYPVTVAQLGVFEEAGGALGDEDSLKGLPNHPAVWVYWHEAIAFCQWVTDLFRDRLPQGYVVNLPSEAQWEKAARGGEQVPMRPQRGDFATGLRIPSSVAVMENAMTGRLYPWGSRFDSGRANCHETGIGQTSAVGCFPGGAGPYGVEELSGNVWEWCATKWEESYEGYEGDNRLEGETPRVFRGGSFDATQRDVRCAYRGRLNPVGRNGNIGFRVVVAPGSP